MGTAPQHTIAIIIHDHGLIITDGSIRIANATHTGCSRVMFPSNRRLIVTVVLPLLDHPDALGWGRRDNRLVIMGFEILEICPILAVSVCDANGENVAGEGHLRFPFTGADTGP